MLPSFAVDLEEEEDSDIEIDKIICDADVHNTGLQEVKDRIMEF